MTVTLDHYTPLHIAAQAIRQCWQSQDKSDTTLEEYQYTPADSTDNSEYSYITEYVCGPNDKALIERIGNKFKHSSTLEHLVMNFTITGVSRALLQELARHRMASPSVKSTRYTLKELKDAEDLQLTYYQDYDYVVEEGMLDDYKKYLVFTGVESVDLASMRALGELQSILEEGIANDKAKYCLPESYKVDLAWTINARSLQNFLALRSSPAALWEIRDLAQAIFDALPEDYKYLFEHCMAD